MTGVNELCMNHFQLAPIIPKSRHIKGLIFLGFFEMNWDDLRLALPS
jgi:hypothetical protein